MPAPPRTSTTRRAPATAKGVATRRRLIDVAADAFGRHGFGGVTMADLVAAGGLTKGAFYFYFSSKEDLALAVLEAKQQEWIDAVRRRLEVEPPGLDRLRALPGVLIEMHRADPGMASVSRLSRELVGAEGTGDAARRAQWNWVHYVADVIRSAQAAGEARRDVDATDAALVLVAAFDGLKDLGDVLDPDRDPSWDGFAGRSAVLAEIAVRGLAHQPA